MKVPAPIGFPKVWELDEGCDKKTNIYWAPNTSQGLC